MVTTQEVDIVKSILSNFGILHEISHCGYSSKKDCDPHLCLNYAIQRSTVTNRGPQMPRQTTTDRLEVLRKKRDQLDEQLKALEARKKETERKADTRRKVIAGALALEHFEANPLQRVRPRIVPAAR